MPPSPARAAPGMDAIYAMPGHLIRRAHQVSTALFAEECGTFGLTSVQFAALYAVRAAGELDATRLAEQIAFDRATIGDVLDRLEAKAWVTRAGSRDDRRIKLIRLTPKGAALLKQVEPAVSRVQERVLAPLSAAERERFLSLLRKVSRV
jgi:MarR family transcriptional regulator, lower aerobic nicotinate degradation pathway regulator